MDRLLCEFKGLKSGFEKETCNAKIFKLEIKFLTWVIPVLNGELFKALNELNGEVSVLLTEFAVTSP